MPLSRPSLSRDLVTYGAGGLFARALAFITFPVYTRVFPPDEYGILALVTTTTALLGPFLAVGGDTVYARFYFEAETDEARRRLTTTWFGFLAAWSATVVVVAILLREPLSRLLFGAATHTALLTVGLAAAPIALFSSLLLQILRNQFRSRLFVVFSLATSVLGVVLGLAAVLVLDMGLIGIVAGGLVGTLLVLPAQLFVVRSAFGGGFSRSLLRPLLTFGIPIVPTSLAFWVFTSSDRYMLRGLATLEEIGLYSVAVVVVSPLILVAGALGQAWLPHAMSTFERSEAEAKALVSSTFHHTLVLAGFGAVAVTVFAPEGLALLAGPDFQGASAAVGPLSLGAAAFLTVKIATTGIFIKKQPRYNAVYTWMAAAANVVLNLLLIPAMGIVGSGWATAAAYVMLSLLVMRTSQRLWPVRLAVGRSVGAVLLTTVFVVTAPLLLPPALSVGSVLLKAGLTLLALVVLTLVGAPELVARAVRAVRGRTAAG